MRSSFAAVVVDAVLANQLPSADGECELDTTESKEPSDQEFEYFPGAPLEHTKFWSELSLPAREVARYTVRNFVLYMNVL